MRFQQLFSLNRGDRVLPVRLELPATANAAPRLFASAARDDVHGEVIVKLVNADGTPAVAELNLAGAKKVAAKARLVVLAGASPRTENSFEQPGKVAPAESEVEIGSPRFTQTVPANSLTVLGFGMDK